MKFLLAAVTATTAAAQYGKIKNGCKATVTNLDDEESIANCELYESEEAIMLNRPYGRILTGSGSELREHDVLLEWLMDEEYKKYENLDLEIEYGEDPVLQIINPRSGRITEEIDLAKHSNSKSDLHVLLTRYDFDRIEREF